MIARLLMRIKRFTTDSNAVAELKADLNRQGVDTAVQNPAHPRVIVMRQCPEPMALSHARVPQGLRSLVS